MTVIICSRPECPSTAGCKCVATFPQASQSLILPPLSDEDRLKAALDHLARSIGRAAVNHLKAMYPAALKSVPKTAEVSLTNHIRNDINMHMRPVLALLVELKNEGTKA